MARPQAWGPEQWPRDANYVMQEIADRAGLAIDPRITVPGYTIEDTALEMSMREVAGHIAAMMGGVWTVNDDSYLHLVPLGDAERVEVASIGTDDADNVESLSVSDPLEPWSGVRAVWDGKEFDASPVGEEGTYIVKPGDTVGFAGDESGRVLEIKIAFGLYASETRRPETLMNALAAARLDEIEGDIYRPFEAVNAVIDPALEIGDTVELPDGLAMVCAMSGELDSLCAADVSAPPDEALNTAYPASWAGLL